MKTMTIAASAAALAAGLLIAGPLNPPAGAVSPTYRTLNEIDPGTPVGASTTPGADTCVYRISAPGKYYLTRDLAGVAGKSVIEIAASNVSLDLRGFTVRGEANDGITTTGGTRYGLEIRDGVVEGMSQDGVDLSNATQSMVRHVRVRSCGNRGLVVSGASIVESCTAIGNAGNGIVAMHGSIVRSSTSRANVGVGFWLNGGAMITGCEASTNDGDGIVAGTGCLVKDNGLTGNGFAGSVAAGIKTVGAGCRVEGNTILSNSGDYGVLCEGEGSLIIRNSVTGGSPSMAYGITGTHTVGPIIATTGTITSNNPWANFIH